MNRVELILNDRLIDIYDPDDFGLRINKVIANSNNLKERGGVYTFTVQFPKTPNNNAALGHINELKQTNKFNIQDSIQAEVIVNGESLLIGTFLISSIDSESYKGVIYGQDIAWSDLLEGRTLQEIQSFPEKEFEGVYTGGGFGIQDYKTKVFNRTENDIAFAFVGYGNYFKGDYIEGDPLNVINDVSFDDIPPQVSFLSVLKYMFQDYGYNIACELFNTTIFKDYYLPYVGSEPYKWNWGTIANWERKTIFNTIQVGDGQTPDYSTSYVNIENIGGGAQLTDYRYFVYEILNYEVQRDFWNDAVSGEIERFVCRKEGIYNLKSFANYINTNFVTNGYSKARGTEGNLALRLLIVKNYNSDLTTEEISGLQSNTNILVNDLAYERVDESGIFGIDYGIFGQEFNEVDLEVGDTLTLIVAVTEQRYKELLPIPQPDEFYTLDFDYSNYDLDVRILNEDVNIKPAKNLPDMSQKDFLKGFLNMFNLFFNYNAQTKTITFVDRKIFYRSPDLSVNLDSVCNIDDFEIIPIEIPTIERYHWSNDEDDYLLNKDIDYANTTIVNNNLYAKGEFNVILPFSATKEREYNFQALGGVWGIPNIAGYDEVNQPLNEVEKNYDFVPRFLNLSRFENSFVRFYINGIPVIWYTCVFSNLFTDGTGFYRYWIRKSLDASNLIKGKAWLTIDQWRKLNDNYFVEIGGDRYKPEEVEAFDPQNKNPTTITLLKEV